MLGKPILLCFIGLLVSRCDAEKIIIDTDAGVDDAMGILLLLKAESLRELHVPQYELIGITCTYGNTKEENVEINVLKTLTIMGRHDIPVYGGAVKPLIGNFSTDDHFGKDGFGDAEFNMEILGGVDKSMHASEALIELSKKHEGNVSIVVLGPTTNVALAASLDPHFVSRVKRFYVMGSSVAGIGNLRPNVEFNFGADPESNFILLNSTTSSQLLLYPWEATVKANITKSWRKNVLGKLQSPLLQFLNAIEASTLMKQPDLYTPADGMLTAIMLWPEIVTSSLDANAQAVYDGAAEGSILVDYKRQRMPNARIIQSIDADKFQESLVYYLSCTRVQCAS